MSLKKLVVASRNAASPVTSWRVAPPNKIGTCATPRTGLVRRELLREPIGSDSIPSPWPLRQLVALLYGATRSPQSVILPKH